MVMMMMIMTLMILKVHCQKWFTLRRSTMKTLRCSSALSMDSACEKKVYKFIFHIFKWQLPVDSACREAVRYIFSYQEMPLIRASVKSQPTREDEIIWKAISSEQGRTRDFKMLLDMSCVPSHHLLFGGKRMQT